MKRLIVVCLALLATCNVFGWGQKGHDVVAYIAENHLTPEAAQRVAEVLGGRSLVYYANWMDNASHTPAYAHTKTWHYMNIDEGETLETQPRHPKGDVLTAINGIIKHIEKGKLSKEEEFDELRMLIHLMGDMHCPMHAGRSTDLGGNRVKVLYFNRETNLHSIWDSSLVESAHNWSYSEWQFQLDRVSEEFAAQMQQGTIEEWFTQTVAIAKKIYEVTPEGYKVSYDYINAMAPVIEQQLLLGGLRLAGVLNNLYGAK
ncbi:MAG: S1/P1 nuclease [Alistipes sp.]|nr:S1/P1 nuclease [Alistipes sp.]MBQ7297093.1 S1/P1 nuclease [Alistipes sp.]